MAIKSLLLLLAMQAEEFCGSLLIEDHQCVDIVTECLYDGESIEWCADAYNTGWLDDLRD